MKKDKFHQENDIQSQYNKMIKNLILKLIKLVLFNLQMILLIRKKKI